MKKILSITLAAVLSLTLLILGACSESVSANEGKIQVYVTDAPPENITSIVIQASKIEIHKASDNESESGWITLLENPPSFDLVQVQGIQSLLGSANITAGKYTQVRLGITSVKATINDEVKDATVPSDKLKIVGNIEVADGETTSISLDFDAEKSIIVTGKGDVSLKPVVKLLVSKPGKQLENTEKEGKPTQTSTGTTATDTANNTATGNSNSNSNNSNKKAK